MPAVDVAVGHAEVLDTLRQAEPLLSTVPCTARSPWIDAWLSAWPDVRPVAVSLRDGGAVAGLACLALRRRGPLTRVVLAGHQVSDYARLPVRSPSLAGALARGIVGVVGGIRGPWTLRFDQLPESDPVLAELTRLLPTAAVEPGQPSPGLRFGEVRTLAEHVSANGRRVARQGRNRARRAGYEPVYARTTDPAEIAELVPGLVAVHRSRDRAIGRRSDLDDPRARAFHSEVIYRFSQRGELSVATLRLGGRVAAYSVIIHDGPVLRTWDGRIADEFRPMWPGRLLAIQFLEDVLANDRLSGVDWMRGELAHKLSYRNVVEPSCHLVAYSSRPLRAAMLGGTAARSRLRAAVPARVRPWVVRGLARFRQ